MHVYKPRFTLFKFSTLLSLTPLLKKPGLDPSVSANFRPISNLNNMFKILERLFLTRLQPHRPIALSPRPNFNPLQSAYRKHHSAETFLIHRLDSIYHAADNGFALSLDHSAAFNTIDHVILPNRLTSSFGITGSSHNWLKSYLSNIFSHLWLNFLLHLIVILWCSTRLCHGSYSFHNLCLTYIASIVSSHGVNQQQYADDTKLFLFISPASLSSSLCSLSGVFLPFTAGSSIMFSIQQKPKQIASAPITLDSNR